MTKTTKRITSAIAAASILTVGGLDIHPSNIGKQVMPVAQAASIPLSDFNGRLYQEHRGNDNRIYIRSSSDGTNWTGWTPAMGSATYSASALAAFNGRLYEAHRGSDNKIYTRSTSDGTNWTGWTSASGATTYVAPAMAAFNGRLYQAHRGSDNQIYTRSTSDGTNWTGWSSAPGTATYVAPAMAAFNGRLYQAHRGIDNKIYTRSTSDGTNWTGWTSAEGATAYSPPAMVAFGSRLYQSHQGMDNKLYVRSSSDGTNWTGWTAPDGAFTPVEADDLNGTPGPGNLLSLSRDQRRAVLGVNPSSGNYSRGGNKFVASNGTGGTYLWCTDYAYGRALEKGLIRNGIGTSYGIGGVISGNAGWWDDNVRVYYPNNVGSTPKANSFVVWDPNQGGSLGAGHVGFVEAVFTDGSFLVSESNWDSAVMSFNLRRVTKGTSAYTTAKFIYLR